MSGGMKNARTTSAHSRRLSMISRSNPRFFRGYELNGANFFSFAPIELRFGSCDRWVILWPGLVVENPKFIICQLLVVILPQILNVESSDFPKKINFSLGSVVFHAQELKAVQNGCFGVKEYTLTFSKHQKSLKSIKNSWKNLNFSERVEM